MNTLKLTVNNQGETYNYTYVLPEWWVMPASSESLSMIAMGMLFDRGWEDNGYTDWSWEVV